MTLLAIDWGQKRIGLARADSQAKIAEPLTTVINEEDALARLKQIAAREKAETVVVGLPRNMSGEETEQSAEIREFARVLEKELQCEVVFQDETLSTLSTGELQKHYPGADKDSLAAMIILKDYIGAS